MKSVCITLLFVSIVGIVWAANADTIYNVDKYGCVSNDAVGLVGTLTSELAFPFPVKAYDECVIKVKATRLSETNKDSVMWGIIAGEAIHYIWVPASEEDDTIYTYYTVSIQGAEELFFDVEIGEAAYSFSYSPQSTTGIDVVDESSQLVLSPNPAATYINIKSPNISNIEVYDLTGRVVLKQNSEVQRIDVSGLNSGIYTLAVVCEGGPLLMEKIIIERQ